MPPKHPIDSLFETLFEGVDADFHGPSDCHGCHCCKITEITEFPGGSKIIKEVPGIDPSTIKITVEGHILIMDTGDGDSCKFGIPDGFDINSITASIDLGLLTVTVNRFPPKIINISIPGQIVGAPEPQKIEAPQNED